MMYRSFVDLVFIMLCALAVIVAQSITLRGLKVDPVDVGAEGAESLPGGEPVVLVVGEADVAVTDTRFDDVPSALASIPGPAPIVVVPESDGISHHRVVAVWWELHQSGHRVDLGVRAPEPEHAP